MSLRFQTFSSMARLVWYISLSFLSGFYLVFSDAIHSFSVSINHLLFFYISVFRFSSIYCLHVQYIHIFYWKHNWMCVLNITAGWNVFKKFLRTKLFLVKFETFPFQAFIFQAILPGILLPNLQSRHFPWPVIQKTTDFSERDNSSRRSLYADLKAAVQNVLQNRCS